MKRPSPAELAKLREQFPERGPRFDYREMSLKVQPRDADPAAGAAPDERIPIALSSEQPVLRYDYWADETYYEVLDHQPSSVDLSYARDGLPFVASHRAWDADSQHGIVQDVAVADDRVLRGNVRMSKAQRSQEIGQDMRDGIRQKVSIGYIVGDDFEQVAAPDGGDGIPTRRYTSWMPIEVSTVPIPADYTVGVDRALTAHGQEALARFRSLHPVAHKAKERTMVPDTPPAAAPAAPAPPAPPAAPAAPPAARALDDDTASIIAQMARVHGFADRTAQLLRDHRGETALRTASQQILGWVEERARTTHVDGRRIELSDAEVRRYSYARVIAAAADRAGDTSFRQGGKAPDDGFEQEISQELRRQLPKEYKDNGGIMVPTRLAMARAGLDSATSTKGTELKFTQPGEFIEFIRARMRLRQLGARLLGGLTGPVTFPRQTGTASHSWVGENPGADVTDSNLLLGTVALAIHTLQGSTSFSRQLLVSALSASVDAENMVREDLGMGAAIALDIAGINGSGSANQPKGVLNTSGIGSVAMGTNGGTVAYTTYVDLETQIAAVDGDIGTMGYLTTPNIRGTSRKTLSFPGVASPAIWQGGGDDGEVNGYRAVTSNNVPKNLVKGSSSNCHAVIMGVWNQLLIGEWGAYELVIDPYRLKKQAMIEVTDFLMADIAVRQTQAFAACADALP